MLKPRQKIGKYKIESKIGSGGYAVVFRAYDTIECIRVALKVPRDRLDDQKTLDAFRREVKVVAALDHPNILPIKNANVIDDLFVIATPLGKGTLADRMQRRVAFAKAISFIEQMLDAMAYAHGRRVVHCDIKPENFIMFEGDRIRLTDFGIAKLTRRTLTGRGTGTIGYCAPEQAMGRPSPRSDLFSMGLVMYQLLTGKLPQWPYSWPLPGHDRLKRIAHPGLIALIQRCLEIDSSRRHPDAARLLAAFRRLKPRILAFATRQGRGRAKLRRRTTDTNWQEVRKREFHRRFGKLFDCQHSCERCAGPVGEFMSFCPWCRQERKKHRGTSDYPQICPRCHRGMKLDWPYCAYCYGEGFEHSDKHFSDKRYDGRCDNPACRGQLMPFSRYCPWCRRKVKKPWRITGISARCRSCGQSAAPGFWSCCPWCGSDQGLGSTT
ncbi:MAG: protein kinase [Planctomycetes bacterium]|nr:protein kinase [Planctomycetota bacterium]